jgi:hypothetical protein
MDWRSPQERIRETAERTHCSFRGVFQFIHPIVKWGRFEGIPAPAGRVPDAYPSRRYDMGDKGSKDKGIKEKKKKAKHSLKEKRKLKHEKKLNINVNTI